MEVSFFFEESLFGQCVAVFCFMCFSYNISVCVFLSLFFVFFWRGSHIQKGKKGISSTGCVN